MFIRNDWELFRSLTTLPQQAGVDQDMLGAIVAKELTDNALDAIEHLDGGYVEVDFLGDDGFFVEDNGPGVDPEILPELFSIKRPLTSSKLLRLPTRGALGNGLRVVTGAVLASGGELRVYTRNRAVKLIPQDDGETIVEDSWWCNCPGTRIEVCLGAGLVNKSTLNLSKMAIQFLTDDPYRGKSSPHWYDSDVFFDLLQAAGSRPVRELISELDGCSGAKAGRISEGYQGRGCNSLDRIESDVILERARNASKQVTARRLGGTGDKFSGFYYGKAISLLERGAVLGAFHASIPFVVEAWVSKSFEPSIQVLVNKTPITAHVWTQMNGSKQELAAGGYVFGKFSTSKTPYTVYINIITPYMPITSAGKAPELTAFRDTVEKAVKSALNIARRGTKSNRAGSGADTQKDYLFEHLPAAIFEASTGGAYRFSERQVFYAIRKGFADTFGKDPQWKYFNQIVTEYENVNGDIPGMYRDNRGSIYHPHMGETIPLGTLSMEDYQRPEWTFNKILYLEKEGFFEMLKAEKWPEKNDCALFTSKGQPTRAARDLVDFLASGDEDITVFCVHDADAYGTLIYQSLQEETKARPRRTIEVINFGLEPWEGVEMGLQIEAVTKPGTKPVANYIMDDPRLRHWGKWLQKQRIELNAMTSQQFLNWLDSKIAPYVGKLIPGEEIVSYELEVEAKKQLKKQISERILREAGLDDLVTESVHKLLPGFEEDLDDICERIDSDLTDMPTKNWRYVVGNVVREQLETSP